MSAKGWRIEVLPSLSDEWRWTAYLERWDGTEWRSESAEDGDTQDEAIEELRERERQARNLPNTQVLRWLDEDRSVVRVRTPNA